MKMKKYRIVKDGYLGFEAQVWRWWWPFWTQMNFTNTHLTIEKAIEFINRYGIHRPTVVWESDSKPIDSTIKQ